MDNEVVNRDTCPACKGGGYTNDRPGKYVVRCTSCGGQGWTNRFGVMGVGVVWDKLVTACAGRYRIAGSS